MDSMFPFLSSLKVEARPSRIVKIVIANCSANIFKSKIISPTGFSPMDSIAVKELLNRKNEIETKSEARLKDISRMIEERTDLIALSNALQQWAVIVEEGIDRFSQGNPTLKSYREACVSIKAGINDMKETTKELSKASIPQFDSVMDAIDRIDVVADEDQQTGTHVEELRAIIGEACGTLDVIIGLLYQ